MTSRLQSFETEVLTRPENWAGLAALNRELIARAEAIAPRRRVVLDMDSPVLSEAEGTEVAVYGEQEQSAYNGHFEPTCYHPLLLFNGEGECLAVKLRPGNVASAGGWEEMLAPEIDRLQAQGVEVAFRGDAAFARPGVYESVEARGARYVIRLPANGNLERKIAELPKRPAGRSSHKPVVGKRGMQALGKRLCECHDLPGGQLLGTDLKQQVVSLSHGSIASAEIPAPRVSGNSPRPRHAPMRAPGLWRARAQ